MNRVIAYVDGFNLYFGLKSKGWKRYYWLNIKELATKILIGDQSLITTKYFTTRISAPDEKRKRQEVFLEALKTLTDFEIFYGKYQMNPRTCKKCGFADRIPNEKMTDVNIATELLMDTFEDRFDTCLLISGDSDLTAPLSMVKTKFPQKRIVIAFPPKRFNAELKQYAHAFFTLEKERGRIAKSIFPFQVVRPDGHILQCPESWR